jgi:hypothetical protein
MSRLHAIQSYRRLPASCSKDIGVFISFNDLDDNTILEVCMVASEHQRVEEDLTPNSSCVGELDCISDLLSRDLHEGGG